MSDCVKVALDFVSPQNVHRCKILADELRSENNYELWMEDKLQLNAMLWYAWVSLAKGS